MASCQCSLTCVLVALTTVAWVGHGQNMADITRIKDLASSVNTNDSVTKDWNNDDLDNWRPPLEMLKNLPVYIAGYDYEKRPVVVCEFGNWDVRKWVEKDEKSREDMYKLMRSMWRKMYKLKSPFEDAEDGIIYIMDSKDFSLSQLSSPETIRYQLASARIADQIESHFVETLLINSNFVVQTWLNIIRPVAGRWVAKVETVGTDQQKLHAILARKIPRDQLPPWYGGTKKDYKPVRFLFP